MGKQAAKQLVGAREKGRLRTDDFHETPREAIEALLKVESFDGPIWEPACGKGAISRVLEEHGHKTASTDLVDRGYGVAGIDFLLPLNAVTLLGAPLGRFNIVTNPPFKLAVEFAKRAQDFKAPKTAFLLRLSWLEGQERKAFFDSHPPARVWVFSKRLPMMHRDGWHGKQSSSSIAFAWFVWDRWDYSPTTLGWL